MRNHSPEPTEPPTFDRQMVDLCIVLEEWRAQRKKAERDSPDQPPPLDWKAAAYAVAWSIVFAVLLLLVREVKGPLIVPGGLWWFWVLRLCASVVVAAEVLQLIRTFGMQTARFWRAHWREFRAKDNYPFTPLIRTLESDMEARSILEPFSTEVIASTHERVQIEESDLRERVASMLGNPSLLALLAVPAPLWAAWQTYREKDNAVTIVILGASILATIALVFGMRLRISLMELARCRALLSLELARRKHG